MAKFSLPELPFRLNALSPHISEETMEFHYGKHHKTYVDNLNRLIQGRPEGRKSLEELVLESSGPIFNNAAQHWNHSFFWNCLSPNGGGEPKGRFATAINRNFGSFSKFKEDFTKASVELFGSGWTWIAKRSDGSLAILQTKDADNPLRSKMTPILACDVWEHAYYIDYRNARPKYLEAFWKVVNWEFAESQLETAALAATHLGAT